ncbi:Zinc finger BED domain-containing protein RICESLEEPER 4 [Linum perenne]
MAIDEEVSSNPVNLVSEAISTTATTDSRIMADGTTAHLNRHSKECPRKPKNLADKNQQQLNIVATINNVVSVNDVENFSDVTNIISGSSYTTANVFLPELWRIKVLLKNTIQSADESMKAMAIKMQQKFDKYWGDSNLVMAFAVVLDPRNKMRVIEVAFPDLYSEDTYLRHLHLVREKLYELFEEYVEEYKARDSTNPSERVAETVAEPSDESGLIIIIILGGMGEAEAALVSHQSDNVLTTFDYSSDLTCDFCDCSAFRKLGIIDLKSL